MSNKDVCRACPATPGLLIISNNWHIIKVYNNIEQDCRVNHELISIWYFIIDCFRKFLSLLCFSAYIYINVEELVRPGMENIKNKQRVSCESKAFFSSNTVMPLMATA